MVNQEASCVAANHGEDGGLNEAHLLASWLPLVCLLIDQSVFLKCNQVETARAIQRQRTSWNHYEVPWTHLFWNDSENTGTIYHYSKVFNLADVINSHQPCRWTSRSDRRCASKWRQCFCGFGGQGQAWWWRLGVDGGMEKQRGPASGFKSRTNTAAALKPEWLHLQYVCHFWRELMWLLCEC